MSAVAAEGRRRFAACLVVFGVGCASSGNGTGAGGSVSSSTAGQPATAGSGASGGVAGDVGASARGGSNSASGMAGVGVVPGAGGVSASNGGASSSAANGGASGGTNETAGATSGGTPNAAGGRAAAGASAGGTNSGGGALTSGGASPTGGASGNGGALTSGGAGANDPGLIGGSLPNDSLAVRFANAVMARWPDPGAINGGTAAFEYNRGIVLAGVERVYEGTKDARYLTYIRRYLDEFVDANGNVTRPSAHSFDTMQPAVLLPFVFRETGAVKYQKAADNMRAVYDSIPRNADGGFWHKQEYPNEMWLDSMYMGEPFLAKYGTIRDCGAFCVTTIVEQMTLIASHVQDPTTGLLYHAWDQDKNAAWANATTGRSPIVWGRALGWYAMTLVDVLPYLPADSSGRTSLLAILTKLASALETAQDSGGLWHQVVDQGSKSDDFLETSASAMFVYSLKLASARGFIDAHYADVANRGFQALMGQVTSDTNGPVIGGAVQGMGVQSTYADYVDKQRLTNSSHGLCGILLAAAAMESRP